MKIRTALLNPGFVLKRVYSKFCVSPLYSWRHRQTHREMLHHFNFAADDFHETVAEMQKDLVFQAAVNRALAECGLPPSFPLDPFSWPAMLYFFVRKLKPKTIVETGVWYGFSTSVLLLALHKNNHGQLISIDLPAYFETGGYRDENPYLSEEKRRVSLPKGKAPGFIVPDFLKQRWQLILGDAKIELPKVLNKEKEIDIFLHDSLHSYQNMTLEFETALAHVKENGFIFSDNIDWNSAFDDFAEKNNLAHEKYLAYFETPLMKKNFGAIRNRKRQ